MSDNRDVGVTFGDLQDDLESEAYPLSAKTLLDRYGEREVQHAGGSVRLGDLLDVSSEETYEFAGDVHQAVLNMVGEGAEGRQGYTDREPNARGEDYEQQSF